MGERMHQKLKGTKKQRSLDDIMLVCSLSCFSTSTSCNWEELSLLTSMQPTKGLTPPPTKPKIVQLHGESLSNGGEHTRTSRSRTISSPNKISTKCTPKKDVRRKKHTFQFFQLPESIQLRILGLLRIEGTHQFTIRINDHRTMLLLQD